VGAADLDHVGEARGVHLEGAAQGRQRGEQPSLHLVGHGDVHHRGEHVVGGLRAVHVVVGVHRGARAEGRPGELVGAVGDHLVGVHVRLGAAAGLPDHQGEVVVEVAGDDLVGGAGDERGAGRVEEPEGDGWPRGGLLHHPEGAQHGRREALAADAKVLASERCVCAPQ
jgi:hypothetical protein